MNENPYKPPSPYDRAHSRSHLGWILKNLVAPAIAMAGTLVIWMASVMLVGRAFDESKALVVWAVCLLMSLAIAIVLVVRLSRWYARPASFVVVFALFAAAFCLLEGDPSHGENKRQALVIYATMVSLPLVAGITAWLVTPKVHNIPDN
ncbi:MAG: hypothetical protein IT423_01610 [Pirellulaceae bacterium]|nr:hypothetical protein [Pirellulaceae bacterium]